MTPTIPSRAIARLRSTWTDIVRDDRGDVPGWVLITLMTAGLPVITVSV